MVQRAVARRTERHRAAAIVTAFLGTSAVRGVAGAFPYNLTHRMESNHWIATAERGCLTVLFVWLAWLPLPFGSVVEGARIPLITVPLFTCSAAALIRFYATRDRGTTSQPTAAALIWLGGAALFIAIGALQLVPLPPRILRAVSPESEMIWSAASHVAALAGAATRAMYPITVDPPATALELFRLAALFAAFTTATLLVRTHPRRIALAAVLCTTAMFEALYGVREAALQRFEIWGWVNRLIFNRITGTFVNPNHFAHYLAIVVPMALFLLAVRWHTAGSRHTPAAQRLARLLEHGIVVTGFALLAAVTCIMAVLLSGSRGALLALAGGLLTVAALLPGRRALRVGLGAGAGLVVIASMVVFLGAERTVARFMPTEVERQTFVGRRIGIGAAVGVWRRFPVLGSGHGTFERVVSMEQTRDLEKIYHHAHNDYVEIAATSGALGALVAFVALAAGYVALVRMTFGPAAAELSWRRRAFQTAALASLTIAMVHALFDFNFFIPSNPSTLAVIAGAAVATLHHDSRTRR